MLVGNLTDFSLTDILQLFTLTKKSGALLVTREATQARVYFRGGDVCFAVSDARRLPLGARLVGGGQLGEQRLRELLDAHRSADALELAEALIQSADADADTLAGILSEQAQEAIVSLLRLEDGDFTFEQTPVVDAWSGPCVPSAALIDEAGRRLEEWQQIAAKVPGDDTVLAVVPNLAGDEVTLSRARWHLLALVDGHRTVADLVDLTGQGEFSTCRQLAGMVTDGLLEVCDGAGRGALAELLAGREALRGLEQLALGGQAPVQQLPAEPVSMAPPAEPVASRLEADIVADEEPADAAGTQTPDPGHDDPISSFAELGYESVEAEPDEGAFPVASDDDAVPADEWSTDAAAADDADAEPAAAAGELQPLPVDVDRAQMARELASLGLDDGAFSRPARPGRAEGNGLGADSADRSPSADEANKGLFSRLRDGVKGN